MSLGYGSRTRWLALAGSLALFGAGCDGCGGEPPPTGSPTLVVSPRNGPTLAADGTSTKSVEVLARDAEGGPDNSELTVTVDGGDLLSDVGSVDGGTLTATPTDGTLVFEYRCPADALGQYTVTATNSSGSASANITCVAPSGRTVLRLVDAEAQNSCSLLQATGASSCQITAVVETVLDSDGSATPLEGLVLSAAVVESTLLGAGAAPDTPASTDNVLAESADETFQQSELTLTTDENGEATFFVHSVALNELAEYQIEVSGTAPDSSVLSETATVEILPFENNAAVRITPAALSMGGGDTATLTIEADNLLGNPADGASVNVRVAETTGATVSTGGGTPDTSVVVVLDADGVGTIEFAAPDVNDELIVLVTAEYLPADDLAALSATSEVTVLPDGSLVVNATATPATIRSDDNTTTTINVTVERIESGTLVNVGGAVVDFEVQSSDLERVTFGSRNAPAGPIDQQTTTDGVATSSTIASTNDRVLGPATIEVRVTYDDDDNAGTPPLTDLLSVTIDVDRDPILQSLVFQSATPPAIGVAGGAYPTSSVLSFKVLDDLNQPLPGATMRFRTNATADPDATVVPTAFTDAQGVASTVLSSGTQAGPISVVATASFQGRTLVVESLPVAVTAGLPSFANSYLVCEEEDLVQSPGPFTATCTAQLADRFTNRVPAGLPVQFRAEGGNIDAAVITGAQGAAPASFQTGQPGASAASLLSAYGDSWSYGAVIPMAGDLGTGTNYLASDAAACFDGGVLETDGFRCDLVKMCTEALNTTPTNDVYCPLKFEDDGTGCWERLEAAAVSGDENDLTQAFLDDAGMTRAEAAAALSPANFTAQTYFAGTGAVADRVRAIIRAHIENMGRCGPLTACILGKRNGVPFVSGDECPVNLGCMDFSAATKCPQDGALTLTAWFRGEESFTDINGNGVLDYDDVDGNGRHDPGEPILESVDGTEVPFNDVVVDMSEPYLDKNDNCSFDDLRGSLRLSTYDAIRHTDQFSDESGDGDFGYVPTAGGTAKFRNGQWDRDKQVFVNERILALNGPARLDVGVTCSAAEVGTELTCPWGAGQTVSCEPIRGGGAGILRGCYPTPADTLDDGDFFQLAYMYTDAHGNCYSPGFDHAMGLGFRTDRRLNVSGEIDVSPLGRGACGLGGAGVLREREWCTDASDLGAEHAIMSVQVECDERFGRDRLASLEIVLDNDPSWRASTGGDDPGVIREDYITFDTLCPFCGDGVTLDPEECDASDPLNTLPCDANCEIIVN